MRRILNFHNIGERKYDIVGKTMGEDEYMLLEICDEIHKILEQKGQAIVAIDGRCGSGKSTLARKLSEKFDCNVFHMDDYYLQKFQRTKERYDEPGGNVDRERFKAEVLEPLLHHQDVFYRVLDCPTLTFKPAVVFPYKKVNIIEGSYSCHPDLREAYDLKIFLDIDLEKRYERIESREGHQGLIEFKQKWIPLEEKYFSAFDIQHLCDLYFRAGD